MSRIIAVLILIFPLALSSQTVLINGSAPGAEGRIIHLYTPADLLTNTEKELAHATVGADGKFELTCHPATTLPATLAIGFHRADLFLEPGMGYRVDVAEMNFDGNEDENPFLQSDDLALKFRDTEKDELNFTLQELNTRYNAFLLKHYNALLRDRDKALVDTFRNEVKRDFGDIKQSYFRDCARYKIAALELLSQSHSQAQLAKTYFTDAPVLYANVEYMDLFNQLFAKYFWVTSRVLKFKDYNAIFKGPDSYARLSKTLAEDTLLKHPQFRELVMMKGLMELFYQEGYDQPGILLLLQTLSEKSEFPENREIAVDLITLLNHLRPGTPAPGFVLQDPEQKQVTLQQFRGKPVLITFWATWCEPCLNDLELLADLYKKYGDRIRFVSISADREFLKMKIFVTMKKNFTWTFLYLGDNLDLLKAYDVKTFPQYVLVDEEGKILFCPAEPPGTGLEEQIMKSIK
ncbi:MAG TPA: TlpA disulfide reductase family protein [Bacteroidales bacterium]|nr:TlpA disulfide reductase family protein [Bacteroidales bacterium]